HGADVECGRCEAASNRNRRPVLRPVPSNVHAIGFGRRMRLKVSFTFALQCSIVPMLSLLREHGPWSRSLSPDPPNVPRIGVGTTSPSPLCRSPIPAIEIQLWQRFHCDQD